MSDEPIATIDKRLLAQLIESIASVSNQVSQLREQMAKAEERQIHSHEEWEQLARDVRCLSKGVTEFKTRFEPYLVAAIDSQREWRDRRSSLMTKVMAAGVIGALGVIGAALWHYAVDIASGRW